MDMLIIMATMMPENMIIEQLEEAIKEYKITQTKDAQHKMLSFAAMLTVKFKTGDSPDKMFELMKDLEKAKKREEIFTTTPS